MAGKKKRKPKFQPTKHDWTALEIEYQSGEEPSIKAFMGLRNIPKTSYERNTKGWGLKRDAIRKAGSKIIFKGLARDYADAMKTHLNWGAGAIKLALDALVPQGIDKVTGLPIVGLKPKTAGEAVKILHLGTVIQKNALITTAMIDEVLKDKGFAPQGQDGPQANIVNVVIDLPSNQKELPG